jgi:hypothetical protein
MPLARKRSTYSATVFGSVMNPRVGSSKPAIAHGANHHLSTFGRTRGECFDLGVSRRAEHKRSFVVVRQPNDTARA